MSTERLDDIDRAASAWVVRHESGSWTEVDQKHFDEWLRASTFNRVAYLRLKRAWDDTHRLTALGAGIDTNEPPPRGHWNLTPFFEATEHVPARARREGPPVEPGTKMHKPYRFKVAMAASLLSLAIVISAFLLWPAGDIYETPLGGVSSVPMVDGSKVTLNTDSRIRVALTATERRIELKYGEAFFEVARDPGRPFVVEVGNRRVVALGTKFSVRRDTGGIHVVVTEGIVRVEGDDIRADERGTPAAASIPRTAEEGASGKGVLLTAGTVARTTDVSVVVEKKSLADAEEQLSWRAGMLVFRNQTLAAAVAEFNRYNARKLVVDDPAVATLRIEGSFRSTNVDDFAQLLEQGYPVRVEHQDGHIVLTSVRKPGAP